MKKILLISALFSFNLIASEYNVQINNSAYHNAVTISEYTGQDTSNPPVSEEPPSSLSSCSDIFDAGFNTDGMYQITNTSGVKDVYCDMTTDGGGWTLYIGWNGRTNPVLHFSNNTAPTLETEGYFYNSEITYSQMRITGENSNVTNSFTSRISPLSYMQINTTDTHMENKTYWGFTDGSNYLTSSTIGENNSCSVRNTVAIFNSSVSHITLLDHTSGCTSCGSIFVGPSYNVFCNTSTTVIPYGNSGSYQYVRYWIK